MIRSIWEKPDLYLRNLYLIKSSSLLEALKNPKGQAIILRGANSFMLDEMDRTIHDCLCAVKNVLEMNSVVPGGGAVEVALAMYLESFARTLGSREQLAVAEFSQALLVIPKHLLSTLPKMPST